MKLWKLAGLFVLAGLVCSNARAAGLKAGASALTITPDVRASKVYVAGFGHNRVATGVHDDLFVRCLALAAGGETAVMCSVDLIGLFYDDVLKVRERVKARAPQVTHVLVASTHDHEGPDTLGLWGPAPTQSGMDEAYMDWLDERIARAAAEAAEAEQPARLTLARDDHPLLSQLQDDSRPPYVKDPFLFVMRLVRESSGEAIATLVNWSDHPETLGGKNTEITADYPHWLCSYLAEHTGGIPIFFNGSIGGLISTLGDQVALQDPETGHAAKDETWKKAELVGTMLGRLSERALRTGEPVGIDSIVVRKATVFAPLGNDWFRLAGALGIYQGRKPLYTNGRLDPSSSEKDFPGMGRMKYSAGQDLETEVNYLELVSKGHAIAEIAAVPGEIYPELVNGGLARYPGADFPDAPFEPTLREHLKTRYQFVFGLANDELGYLIPKCEWDNEPPWLLGRPERWYGEINSAGPEVAGAVMRRLVALVQGN